MEASRAATEPRGRTSLRQLALLRRPSERAFEQLYHRHAREVYQYALALTANPADAEDVTQTTFMNAYRAFQKGERPQKPHNWLIAIAHNVCRMRWRQAGSRPREVTLEEAPEPASREDEQPDLDEVLTALSALSFNQRAAIVMRELEGRSYQEISGVLGLSVSAVEALLFRARRNLQVRRRSLGVLTTVPLPGSLASFIGGGGGAVVAGSAAVGAVLKAAAVVAVGAATAGLGYKSVQAMTAPQAAVRAAAVAPKPASKPHRAASSAPAKASRRVFPARASHSANRHVVAARTGAVSRPTGGPSGSLPTPEQQTAPSSQPAVPVAPPPPVVLPTPQLPPPPVAVPPVPPLPPLPPLPVTVPVPVPPLPPPPPLPPIK
jgi:RNA polymerase sigma factor (sigma-70 family)